MSKIKFSDFLNESPDKFGIFYDSKLSKYPKKNIPKIFYFNGGDTFTVTIFDDVAAISRTNDTDTGSTMTHTIMKMRIISNYYAHKGLLKDLILSLRVTHQIYLIGNVEHNLPEFIKNLSNDNVINARIWGDKSCISFWNPFENVKPHINTVFKILDNLKTKGGLNGDKTDYLYEIPNRQLQENEVQGSWEIYDYNELLNTLSGLNTSEAETIASLKTKEHTIPGFKKLVNKDINNIAMQKKDELAKNDGSIAAMNFRKTIGDSAIKFSDFFLSENISAKIPILSKQFPNIQNIDQIAKDIDPTYPKAKYITWILRMMKSKALIYPEDASKYKQLLKDFDKVYKSNKFKGYKDINLYNDFATPRKDVDDSMGIENDRKGYTGVLPDGATVIYNNDPFTVIKVTTPEAANILFKNSHWCVVDLSTAKRYLEKGPFYLFLKSGYNYVLYHLDDIKDVNDRDLKPNIVNEILPVLHAAGILDKSYTEYDSNERSFVKYTDYPDGVQRKDIACGGYIWTKNGKLESINGEPSCLTPGGNKYWHKNGMLHREDGPAIIIADGYKEWWINDRKHRVDGPAVIYPDGTEKWFFNDRLHREDGPAVIDPNGDKEWYLNGKRHRIGGPAIEYPGDRFVWIVNGQYHREDGPAVEAVGRPVRRDDYYLNGNAPSDDEYKEIKRKEKIRIDMEKSYHK